MSLINESVMDKRKRFVKMGKAIKMLGEGQSLENVSTELELEETDIQALKKFLKEDGE